MNIKQNISFVAGKSGGHIIPCLTIANTIKQENPSTQILFFSTTSRLDHQMIHANPAIDIYIPLSFSQARPHRWYLAPKIAWNFLKSTIASLKTLRSHKIERVITTGGCVALPVCIAARILRIPIELYELNVEPGATISWLAAYAHTINICFEKTKHYLPNYHCTLTEYPLRFDKNPITESKQEICTQLGLELNRPTLLVLGGSQGSIFVNNQLHKLVENHPDFCRTMQIIHQTGSHNSINWKQFYQQHEIPAYVFDFDSSMARYYTAADIVISRAGAGALFELLYFNKPTIIIPLELKKNEHQLTNAREMVLRYQRIFSMIRQQELDTHPDKLYELIMQTISSID